MCISVCLDHAVFSRRNGGRAVHEVLAVVQVDPWVCAAVKTGEEHDSDKHWPCRTDMRLNYESHMK